MKLRRATERDFERCKLLQDTDDADILYYDCDWKKESGNGALTEEIFFSEEDLREMEKESNFTSENFNRILKDKNNRIYVFENDDNIIIAYVLLFKFQRYSWKLAEMQIEKCFQTMAIFTQMVERLFLQKEIKEIDVCTFVESTQRKFCEVGFYKEFPSYFRKNKKL